MIAWDLGMQPVWGWVEVTPNVGMAHALLVVVRQGSLSNCKEILLQKLGWLFLNDFSEKPLEFVSPLEDTQVPEETKDVTLECELSKDKPEETKVVWKKDKDTLSPDDEKYVMKRDGRRLSLTIKDVKPEDEAEYTCVVEGKETSAKVTVEGE